MRAQSHLQAWSRIRRFWPKYQAVCESCRPKQGQDCVCSCPHLNDTYYYPCYRAASAPHNSAHQSLSYGRSVTAMAQSDPMLCNRLCTAGAAAEWLRADSETERPIPHQPLQPIDRRNRRLNHCRTQPIFVSLRWHVVMVAMISKRFCGFLCALRACRTAQVKA